MLGNAGTGVVCQGGYPEVQHHVLIVLTVLRSSSYAGQRNRVFIGDLCWIRCLLTLTAVKLRHDDPTQSPWNYPKPAKTEACPGSRSGTPFSVSQELRYSTLHVRYLCMTSQHELWL